MFMNISILYRFLHGYMIAQKIQTQSSKSKTEKMGKLIEKEKLQEISEKLAQKV